MSTITSNNPNPLPGGFPNTGSNIGAAPSATPPLELGTVIKAGGNNKALLDQLVQTLGTQQGNASDGLKNANGAPAIASPLDSATWTSSAVNRRRRIFGPSKRSRSR